MGLNGGLNGALRAHLPAVRQVDKFDLDLVYAGRLLRAALWFGELRPAPRDTALTALRSWLDSWTGIGAVAVGMAHQGYDLQSDTVRRSRLAGDVLHQRDGAFDHRRNRFGVRAVALACDPAGGAGGARAVYSQSMT
jgi:hypothetical protein